MISFCYIPFECGEEHRNKYGNYAIGLNKRWMIDSYGDLLSPFTTSWGTSRFSVLGSIMRISWRHKKLSGDSKSGELRSHCRHGMKYRRHIRVRHKTKVRNIPDRVSIHDRPSEAAISPSALQEKRAHDNHWQRLGVPQPPQNSRRTECKGVFCWLLRLWQKGAIENANKLIRQYIPKGTDFNLITDDFLHSVQLKINRRPREKLNFSTPKDEFFKFLS